LEAREKPEIHFAYDMIKRHFITRSFVTVQSEATAGISRESSIVSHDKEPSSIYLEFIDTASSLSSHSSSQIGFVQSVALLYVIFRFADLYAVMLDLHGLSRKSDDPFDVRNDLSRRHKDYHVSSIEFAESRRNLIHDDEIVFLERRRHARSHNGIRISDKESDEQYDSSYEHQK